MQLKFFKLVYFLKIVFIFFCYENHVHLSCCENRVQLFCSENHAQLFYYEKRAHLFCCEGSILLFYEKCAHIFDCKIRVIFLSTNPQKSLYASSHQNLLKCFHASRSSKNILISNSISRWLLNFDHTLLYYAAFVLLTTCLLDIFLNFFFWSNWWHNDDDKVFLVSVEVLAWFSQIEVFWVHISQIRIKSLACFVSLN